MEVMTQRWCNLLFAHWAYDPDTVRALLPTHLVDLGVELDCFEGSAFVGLIPFHMRDLRLRGLPRIPTTADFSEINVRTYVTYKGRPAVWFFSLDTAHLLPTVVARLAFRLPYCFGNASVTVTGDREGSIHATHVERRWPDRATTSMAARIGAPMETTPLASFLTARWGLISTTQGDGNTHPRTYYGAVDHEPWQLHSAELLDLDDELITSAGLPRPEGDPILFSSPGVTTTIYSLERLTT